MPDFGQIHPIYMLAGGAMAGILLGLLIQLFKRRK